ncbi:MAG: amidohydrolase family protein [Gemmatimonadota bacterium]
MSAAAAVAVAARRGGVIAAAVVVAAAPLKAAAQVAVLGEIVHTMAGAPIANGVVLIGADGRIERVGPAAQVPVPAGYRTLSARVVTPGLIDAHSVVGLAGHLGQPHEQDQLETSDAIQPSLRAVDAYNARERLVGWVRSFGVTTLHTGHGPGALASGQTIIVKTRGDNIDEAVIDTLAAIAMTLGPEVSGNYTRPGTRAKGVAMLRAKFVEARSYAEKRRAAEPADEPARNLDLEMFAAILDRDVPVLMTAQRVSEIMAALRLREEFRFDLILDGAAEAYLVIDEIRDAGVPVILHPTMARHSGALENATLETARLLRDAGITVALQSGFEGYVPKTRVVLFEAAMAAAYGLDFEAALATITRDAAAILGIAHRVGSLETGKDGDVALFDGDPFEYASHVCGVIIEGVVVEEGCT